MSVQIASRIRQSAWIVVIPLFFCLILFRDAIFSGQTLFHMDWAPYFPRSNWIGPWQHFVVNHAPFSLMHFMKACLPLRFYHVAFYIIAISGTTWALYAYLRDRGLVKEAALLGGIAFGFSGYCVSLVSAGHRGVFEACLSAAILLFVGSRAVRRGNWYYYVYSALAIALVIGTQPDVFIILLMVVAPLLCVDFIYMLRERQHGYRKRLGLGLLAFTIAFTVFGWRGVERIVNNYLPGREALIEKAGAPNAEADADNKWIFCTNWSLPPSDCAELIAPLVFGIETADRQLPFWGELGRSYGWEPGAPGFPNYRQHTIYAGGFQLVLALYAIFMVFRRPKTIPVPDRALLGVATGLIVLTFALALGRYTPFYRLFYTLPLASSIRAPIKFLHATNLAGALLCAFGVHMLADRMHNNTTARKVRDFLVSPEGLALIFVGVVLGLLVAAKLAFGDGSASMREMWQALGFNAQIQKGLLHQFNRSLVHAMVVVGIAGIPLVCVARGWGKGIATWVPWGFALAVAIDMTVVNTHYVNTVDLSVHEMQNVIVEDIIAGKDHKPRVLELLTGWNKHHPIRANLAGYYSQDIVMVGEEQLKNSDFIAALRQGGAGMREALLKYDVEYVIAPVKLANALESLGGSTIIDYYGFDGRRFVRASPRNASVVLLAVNKTETSVREIR